MFITVKLNTGERLEFNLNETKVVIGRSPKCQVVIPHEGLSRQHCLIEIEHGEIFVTDLDSTNGVFIDGTRIQPSRKTEFKTYLPLSFGPVDSLLVEFEKPEEEKSPLYEPKKPVNVHMSSKIAKEKQATKIDTKTLKPKDDDLKYKILAVLVIVIFLAFTYWYLENQNASEGEVETTEETSVEADYN